MEINKKLVVAATSVTLSIAAVLLPFEESMASILPVAQYNHSVSNYLVKYSHEISQQLMVV